MMKKTNKRTAVLTALTCGMDAAVSTSYGIFAKQKFQRTKLSWMTILFAIAMALTACPADSGSNSNSAPAHTHQWGAWTQTKAPTETQDGEETRTCALDASHKETRPIAALNHTHQWGAWVQTKAPTETQDGEETRTCALNPAHKETRPIAALNHTHQWGAWAETTPATCTAKGAETRVCALDPSHKETRETAVNPDAHQWGAWAQTKAPTETQDGEETRTCALNPAHKETRPVAMPELTGGGVTITGETRTGATLTAHITAGNGTGARAIQWLKTKDNATANIGANSESYTLADTDIGHTIKVVVTYANNKGTYSATAEGEVKGPITRTITVPNNNYANGNGLKGQTVTIEIPYEVSAKLDDFFRLYNLLETYDTQAKQIDHIVDKFNNAFINADSTLMGQGGNSDMCNTVLNRNLTIIIKESLSSGWVSADNWNTISFRIGGATGGLLARTDTALGNAFIDIMVNDMYTMSEQGN